MYVLQNQNKMVREGERERNAQCANLGLYTPITCMALAKSNF